MKNTSKFIVAALFLTQAAFSSDWDQSTNYSAGDQITYKGTAYTAMRDVAPNTAPNTADDGWFWTESAVAVESAAAVSYSTPVTVEADTVKIVTNYANPQGSEEITLDSAGIKLYNGYMGGSKKSHITYGNVTLEGQSYFQYNKTELTPALLKISTSNPGAVTATEVTPIGVTTGGEFSSVKRQAAGTLDGDELSLANPQGTVTLRPIGGLSVSTSYGTTTVSDHGVKTSQTVEAASVVSGGVNLNQKIAQFEARIAELEAALEAK